MPRVQLGPFSVEVPLNWTMSSVILTGPVGTVDTDVRMLGADAQQPFKQNLIATMEQVGSDETARSYVERQIEGLRNAQVDRRELVAPTEVSLRTGATGILLEQMIGASDGEYVGQMQLVTIKDRVAYTLIASHLYGPLYDQAREHFRLLLLSFE
jgi:hypothetical protein